VPGINLTIDTLIESDAIGDAEKFLILYEAKQAFCRCCLLFCG